MNGPTMLYEWRLGADVIASGAAPGFTNTQVYSLLNRAQDYIIKERVTSGDYGSLFPILVDSSAAASGGTNKLYYRAVPADYWIYITSHSTLTRASIDNSGFIPDHTISSEVAIQNDTIEADAAIKFLPSSFNSQRIFKEPKSYILNNNLYVIADDYSTVTNIVMRYIRKRATIDGSTTCELPEVLHRAVVDKAIDIAKVIINVQEPQSNN